MVADPPGGLDHGPVATESVTEREAEVLALLADRLSNVQIARELHISVRTVEHHVSALLRKYGAADRRALAEFASRGSLEVSQRLPGLPRPHTSLIGRAAERDLVRAKLAKEPIVTLLGPGGVGKTRLAIAVAETVAPGLANRGGFIDLVSVRDGFVESAVGAGLRVSQAPQQPLLATITEHLGDHPALLVFDNCEHLLEPVAVLVARILAACPAVAVLVTSRERLRLPGEHTVRVDPLLHRDDAVALFRDRATAVDPRFEADTDTVARICDRVDGMPLAIELAAARAPALGAQGLMTALNDVMRVLAGGRNLDHRHRSLRAMIDWSYQLMEEPERVLFRRLAIFAGAFDLRAGVAIADLGDATVVADLLGRLVDKSLVVNVIGTNRWRLLDTVRAYASEQLTASGDRESIKQLHLRWAQQAAAALESRLGTRWQDEFDAIVDDLLAGLHDLPPGPEPTAHRLGRSLGRLSYARHLWQQSVDRYREAARHAPTPADAAADLAAASDCAAVYRADLAFELILEAAEEAGRAGANRTKAVALARAVELGSRFRANFKAVVPRDRLRELHCEAVALGDPDDPALTAANSIGASWTTDPARLDIELAESALAAAKSTGDPVLTWSAIDTVASVYDEHGHLRRAYELVRTALPFLDELDRDDPRAGRTIRSIHQLNATFATTTGQFLEAIELARSAIHDPVVGEPLSLARMVIPPLVLTGEFDEALLHGDAMWRAWESAGRPTAGWLWFPAATAALASGLTDDLDGYRRWRNRMADLAGPQNAYRLRTASSAHFVDARMAIHTGDTDNAADIVRSTFNRSVPGTRFQIFAEASAAELAVVARLPDAAKYLAAAENLADENAWCAATLTRALGRYHGDAGALRESVAGWERVGARFERDYTRLLLHDA
ncbi:LuxR C-terminal-related transcriptional regulator [Micromonospora sp. WMMD1102]|uniref:ATP-binding protein n=1 Tax=Micromonospora sp. WMMD1102 TaxID=3016105 RepID=UPI00241534D1|nr:LuxR C-terminal-related transcriptional regulator [Micromonospora sp. WMMD1102]MDG4791765.1 LuxR C-terminal-related transcriptional regulator [Micromonospora sp. WMMD1102]